MFTRERKRAPRTVECQPRRLDVGHRTTARNSPVAGHLASSFAETNSRNKTVDTVKNRTKAVVERESSASRMRKALKGNELQTAGERIRTADVQLGKSKLRLQTLVTTALTCRFLGKNEDYKRLTG